MNDRTSGLAVEQPAESPSPPARPGRVRRSWVWPLRSYVWGGLLLFWAIVVTWLLLAPPEWGVGRGPWLRPAGHFLPLLGPYAGLFAGGSWNWLVGAELWRDVAIGAGGLGVIWMIGGLFVSRFAIYVPRAVQSALALAMGLGLCGVVYTFLAMAGFLYQWIALLVLLVGVTILLYFSRRAALGPGKKGKPGAQGETDPYLQRRAERQLAQERERKTWIEPRGFVERGLAVSMRGGIAILTALTFYHGVLLPEVYWDSLILYLGYSRMTFLEHGFPVKVVAQVGIGLGANYPHLYELTGAIIAAWANRWSPVYLQIAAPLAGLATLVLVYHTVLRLSRNVLLSLAVALLVRSLPYVITYHTFASNYAFAVLYCAAFFYCALRYVEDGLGAYLFLAALACAFGVHVNYLMWALWPCWFLTVAVAYRPRRIDPGLPPEFRVGSVRVGRMDVPLPYTEPPNWPVGTAREPYALGQAVRGRAFVRSVVWGGAISSIWYARNWIVTGNPVYAFFSNVLDGRHINPEVLASASTEWMRHGDGIGIYDAIVPGLSPLVSRFLCSWFYFVNEFKTAYKFGPTFMALVVPGVLGFLAVAVRQALLPRRIPGEEGPRRIVIDDATRFGFVAFAFMAILFAYHYTIGPYYMYHLLTTCAAFGVFIYFATRALPPLFVRLFCAWALFCFLMPALPWALMGSKLTSNENRVRLIALHNPGMAARDFYRVRFGQDVAMWDYVNTHCRGTAILTHENRDLVFDPSIRLVHMDDWEVQQVWGKPKEERLRALRGLGVRYYLRVPYETDHPVNARLGHEEWIRDGTLAKVCNFGDDTLYRFDFAGD